MISSRVVLTLAFALWVSIILSAQQINYNKLKFAHGFSLLNWQSEDGLPQNSILSLFQDKDGYLWCGTQHGLVRFDGYSFTSVTEDKQFISNGISSIIQDRDGSIWIGTLGAGIIILRDGISKSFKGNSQLKSNYISCIEKTKNNEIIVCSNKEIRLFLGDSSRSLSSELNLQEQLFTIQCIDKNGKIWIVGEQEGLFSFQEGKLSKETHLNNKFQSIRNFYWVSDTEYILIDSGRLVKYFPEESRSVKIEGAANLNVRKIALDQDGNLWIAGNNKGLFLLKDQTLIKFPSGDGVIYNLLSTVYCDKENNVWVGSLEGGLTKITPGFLKTVSQTDGLSNEFVFTIAEDKRGTLYIGTYGGGLFTFDGRRAKSLNFSGNYKGTGIIRSLIFDKTGNLFIGTYGDGIFIGKDGRFIRYTKKDGLTNNFIYAQVFDNDGNLWIGTAEGLVKYDGVRFKKVIIGPGLDSLFIRALTFDKDGGLWIGTDRNGVIYLKNGQVKKFTSADGLASDYIRSLYIDRENTLWICSGAGLTYLKNGKIKNIKEKDGLIDNLIYQVIEDKSRNFWITSNKGIIRILQDDLKKYISGQSKEIAITIFNRLDGMLSSECNGGNTPAGILLKSGEIAIPTLKGLVLINPEKEFEGTSFPVIVFESLFGDEFSYPVQKNISIPPGVKRLEINFNSPSFRDPRKIRFRYRIKEQDEEWINLGNSRKIVFNRLGSGEYTLELTSTNQAGQWNITPVQLHFTIEPYFYETKAFYFFIVLVILVIGPAIYIYRVRRLERQKIELEKIIEEKTSSLIVEKEKTEKALQDANTAKELLAEKNEELTEANRQKTNLIDIAVHDLKNPLHAIRGFSQLILEEVDDQKERESIVGHIRKSTDIMLEIINNLLKSSAIESGKIDLNKTEFDASELVKEIIQRHLIHAGEKNQQILYSGTESGIVYNDRERLGEILDNLISNAVKYSPGGAKIETGFMLLKEGYKFFVKDEGPGFTENDKKKVFGKFQRLSARPTGNEHSTGLGLSIVKDLVKLTGGHIILESEKGKGALFTVEYISNK